MIYLDSNANSRLRKEAREVLARFAGEEESVRNPSSVHRSGRRARAMLREARERVLEFLAAKDARLVFTSGGTEACSQMLLGFLGPQLELAKHPAHIISSSIEHPAVLEPLAMLEQAGWEVSYVDPCSSGIVDPNEMLKVLRDDTCLVTLMAANNETGALQPVKELARLLRKEKFRGIIASDHTQALGKSLVDAAELARAGVDVLSLSGHKVGAPVGTGALVFLSSSDACQVFYPMLRGGPQEERMRGGTENLLGALAWAEVLDSLDLEAELKCHSALRELLWSELESNVAEITRLTPKSELALSNTLLVQVSGLRGDDLVVALDLEGVAASTGSACSSGRQEVSHVIRAMGLEETQAQEVVRFSLDWDADVELVKRASRIISEVIVRMRGVVFEELPDQAVAQ